MPSAGDIMAGRAFVLLYAHDTPLYRGLKMAERRVQQFAYNANRIGRSMLTMATAAGAPLAFAARTFANFQDVMKEVQAVTGATGQEFDTLYEKAKRLGSTTSFTASQVAEGMANLGRQGFKPDEIDAAIPSVLNLARATKTELAAAATIAAGTLRALGMEAKEMPRVADVLTATANNSSQTLEELGDTMKYAAPIADEMGLSIEQTAKAVGVLANMQIKGTMAGTALRKIMGSLASTDVQEKLRKVHVEALNADRSLRPLGDVMVELGQAMARMTNAERISFAQDLFGERAYGAALKLSKGGFEDLAAAIDTAGGSAERTAALMDSGLGGTIRRLLSAAEGVQIAVGEALAESLGKAGDHVTELLGKFQQWVKENRETVVTVAKIVAGLAAFGAAAIAVGSVAGSIAATINLVAMAIGGLSTAMAFMAANPLVVLAAGFVTAAGAIAYFESSAQRLPSVMGEVREKADEMRAADKKLFAELTTLASQQGLSNAEMGRAATITNDLQARYGDLGIVIDRTTGKIHGMATAQDRLNKEMRKRAVSQMRAELQAAESELTKQEADRAGESPTKGEVFNPRKFVRDFSRMFMSDEEMIRADAVERDKIAAARAHIEYLREEIKQLQSGVDFVGESSVKPAGGTATTGLRPIIPDDPKAIEEMQKMRERMQKSLANDKLALIDDEHRRRLAQIDAEYGEEIKALIKLRDSKKGLSDNEIRSMTEATKAIVDARQQAIAAENHKHDSQKRFESDRADDELKRIKIETEAIEKTAKLRAAGAPNLKRQVRQIEAEKTVTLIELDRQRELRNADITGDDKTKINEVYDARRELAKRQREQEQFADIARGRRQLRDAALAPTAQAGSLEAYQAMARHNDPALSVQKNQLRKLHDIERNTSEAAEKAGVTVIEVGIGDD